MYVEVIATKVVMYLRWAVVAYCLKTPTVRSHWCSRQLSSRSRRV